MKRIIFLSYVFLFCSLSVIAQKQKEEPILLQLPVDDVTKKITYTAVVEVQGLTASQLYKKALEWFRSYYKNPTEVIRENDSVQGKVVGKPRFKIYNPADKSGTRTDGGIVQYTITVAARDGRFKYELTEFNWKQASYYPCERWYDKSLPSYSPNHREYILQTDTEVRSVISGLRGAMTGEKKVKKDDW